MRADENMTDALHFVFLELGRMKYTDEQRRRYEAEFFAELEKKSELKAAKVEVEIISRASGLTVEEVEAL